MCVPMATTNLFTDPVFRDGAFTSQRRRACAPTRCRRRCARWTWAPSWGRATYVFWGGREGAEVDAGKDPVEAIKRFREALNFLLRVRRATRGTTIASRSRPSRTSRAATSTSRRRRRISRFIATLDHPEMVGVNPEMAHEHMAGLNFFHAVAQALEAGKLFHIDLNDQKPGRFDQDLRFGSESHQGQLLRRQAARGLGLRRAAALRRARLRTEDQDGVWEFARGCMRTYLILKEKVQQFNADAEIQALLKELADTHGEKPLPAYSSAAADALKARSFDRVAIASKGLAYERLDQLVIDLLLGVR